MRRLLVVVLACALLAGCKVDTLVTIDVDEDGSGTVQIRVVLDAEAVRHAEAGGGTLEDRVRLGDLPAAGWTVSPWKRGPDGGATLTLRQRFSNAGELESLFDEVNGENGPVRDVMLERDRSFLFTEYQLTGVADLSQLTAAVAADPELVAQLTGQRVAVAQVDQRLARQIREVFRLRIRLVLPGGDTKELAPRPGRTVSLDTSISQLDTTRALLLGAAVALGALGVFVFVRGEMRSRRRRR